MDLATASHPFLFSERNSMDPFIRLASESEISSADESVSSAQMTMTATCQDTPDTSSTEESELEEFTVPTTASDSVPAKSEVSSGPEDFFEDFPVAARDQKMCVKCHAKSFPFPYCRSCYRDRKRFLPPRPIGKKGKKKLHKDQVISIGEKRSRREECEEFAVKASICTCCMSAPPNGLFIHGDIGHQLFCYTCSYRIWLERHSCPYCNRLITKVVKIFPSSV